MLYLLTVSSANISRQDWKFFSASFGSSTSTQTCPEFEALKTLNRYLIILPSETRRDCRKQKPFEDV